MKRRSYSDERGQASVELLGLLPNEEAGEAAEAAALALLQGGEDPRAAAVAALPEAVRRHATITVAGRRVHVRVLARLPISSVAKTLAGKADAIAGADR
jgi:hypothetical protein